MAGLEHDSYHEAVPEPRGFIDPQRRYARQRYAVDTEAAAMQDWVPPPTARASSELEARDDKMNAWAGPEEDNRRPVPDGNSEVVLLDHSGKGSSGGKTPIEPLGDPDIVCLHVHTPLSDCDLNTHLRSHGTVPTTPKWQRTGLCGENT